jgi:hypothetical protein
VESTAVVECDTDATPGDTAPQSRAIIWKFATAIYTEWNLLDRDEHGKRVVHIVPSFHYSFSTNATQYSVIETQRSQCHLVIAEVSAVSPPSSYTDFGEGFHTIPSKKGAFTADIAFQSIVIYLAQTNQHNQHKGRYSRMMTNHKMTTQLRAAINLRINRRRVKKLQARRKTEPR